MVRLIPLLKQSWLTLKVGLVNLRWFIRRRLLVQATGPDDTDEHPARVR